MNPHPTHAWPDEIRIGIRCTRCNCLRGTIDAALRCVPVDDGDSAGEPAEDWRAPEDWVGRVPF